MSEATRDWFDTLNKVLLRCWVLGTLVLVITSAGIMGSSEMVHYFHGLFGLTAHESDLLSAAYAAVIKASVAVFFFVPWLAIRLVLKAPNA